MSKLLACVNAIGVLFVCSAIAFAQSNPTDGSTALALSPGAPAGSYSLSDFESINPYSGTVNFSLPLFGVTGRGQARYSITQGVRTTWSVDRFYDTFEEQFYYSPKGRSSGWNLVSPGYGIGALQGRYGGSFNTMNCTRVGGGVDKLYVQTLTRLTFTAADGTEYELRDQLTGGAPASVPVCATSGFSRGKVFVTADGTAVTFFSDDVITDRYLVNDYGPFTPSGYLMLANGTRYRILNGQVQWVRDRNGNMLSFTYSGGALTQVTDSLNRQVTVGAGVTFKGAGGSTRSVQVSTASLSTVLRAGYSIQTYAALFPELNGSSATQFNPSKISAITLPNNKQYRFFYNNYGELARVELPTGGAIEYDWAAGLTNSSASGAVDFGPVLGGANNWQIYRRVVERRIYPDGGTGSSYESRTTFSRPETIDGSLNVQSDGYVVVDQYNATGTLLTRAKHYYFGNAGSSLKAHSGISYASWKEGKEYKTEIFHSDGTTVLRRVEHTWQQPISGSTWPLTQPETSAGVKPNNPQITDTITTLEPNGSNLVTKQSFAYDKFLNRTNVYEYGFGTGTAGALVRRSSTTFLTTNTVAGTAYDYACDPATNCSSAASLANVIHIRNLPQQTSIYDAAGVERARISNEFDNYASDTNHASLTSRSAISGLDASFTTAYVTRGNPTGTTQYLISTAGAVTGSVSGYQQYDIAGNVVKTIDARGNATTFAYDDCFGAPDGNARLNSAPTELSSVGQQSYALVTSVTNALGHTAFSQFDYYLQAAVDTEDANGIVTSGYFNDLLDRPTQVRRAVGTAAASQTTISYDDDSRIVTTTSDIDNNNLMVAKTVYDGLGRTIENRQYEGGTNYIAVQQQYDALGRVAKTSNPFRPYLNETAVWTTATFDALSRVTSVTTPDNAAVTTSYSGNTVTLTDQAGKSRKSVTDALGRLVDIYEDPNALNYQTSYLYDALNNLVRVTQGTQQRFFMYDSLKRLIRARNPEQSTNAGLALSDPLTGNSAWSIGYQYDANANLTQKTDARGVVSTYVYDALNRNTTIDYSDTASINPDVKWFYDGATNGKGRFWYFYKGGDFSTGSNVDHKAIDSYDAFGRPTVQRQLFKLNGTWSPTYQISRGYNLAGAVTSQTYPSGHTVSYSYDVAGRTTSFSGNLGDGVTRTYASSFIYNARNQITQELFGTQTPLYHKLQYNVRGQLWDVRVSTGSDVNGSWNRGCLQYFYDGSLGYGTSGTDNNGNVLFANTYIPLDDQSNTWAINRQSYSYDALNRLSSVAEYFVTNSQAQSQQSLQSYTYDRWGNRTINPASWGTGINVKQFSVDTTTNRLGVPAGQTGAMSYDNAGNLTNDTYTGVGARTYDAENKMLTAADNTGQTSRYTYDAEGNRTRRQVGSGQEAWQIYGMDSELLAEYPASTPASAPTKEYGYRDGQLLITAEPGVPGASRVNAALAANGGVASASSSLFSSPWNFTPAGANNGNRSGAGWGSGEGWNDNSPANTFPDWLQIDFNGSKTIDEIDVFTGQDNWQSPSEPTEAMTFSVYGLTGYDVQYWNGSSWTTVPGGSVTANNKVWRKFTFSPITTTKIRVLTNASVDGYSRITEVEAWVAPPRGNVALAANGGTATASSSLWATPFNFTPAGANNGNRSGSGWGSGEGWNDNSPANTFPDWLQIDFSGNKTIDEIDVFTAQDNWQNPSEPTETMTFSVYGLTGYDVQYWNGSAWVTVTGGSVTGNNKVWRKFTFTPVTTSKIRVLTNASTDGYSRITEVEVWGHEASGSSTIRWLVPDHLGTPRIILDQTGSLANVRRHDYLPFGEELFAGTGGRTIAQGYAGDGVRQQFTQYERDVETGLDYAVNRYYFASQGRFSGPDPYIIVIEKEKGRDDKERSQILLNYCLQPQIWNQYTYSLNNPLRYVDPDGRRALTEVDLARIERLNQEYDKAKQAGDVDLANAISQAVNEIVTAIDAVPEGQEDPSNLKTVFFAIDQLGNKSFATNESNTFSMNGWRVALGPGDNKCNFFVAMSWALGGGIGLNGDGKYDGSASLWNQRRTR